MKKIIFLLTVLMSHLGYSQPCPPTPVQQLRGDSLVARKIKLCGATPGLYKFNSNFHFVPAVAGTDYQTALFLSVKDFGAVGDGVTNDSAAFAQTITSAASTGKAVFIPAGTYLVYNVAISSNVRITGSGNGSMLKPRNSSGQAVFTANSANNWTIDNLKFIGYNTTPGSNTDPNAITNSTNMGVFISNSSACQGWNITKCTFYGFAGYGISCANTTSLGGRIVDNYFTYCYAGIFMRANAEYNLININQFVFNTYGVWNKGANNKYTGNSMSFNYYGCFIDTVVSFGNSGRGSLVGNDFNHCAQGLRIDRIQTGMAITGNNFATCNVVLVSAVGCNFSGNNFSGSNDTIKMDACTDIYFNGNHAPTSTTPIVQITNLGVGVINGWNNFLKGGVPWEINSLNVAHTQGQLIVGSPAVPSTTFSKMRIGVNSAIADIGASSAGTAAIWLQQTTPSATNYTIRNDATVTYLNAPTSVNFRIGNSTVGNYTSTIWTFGKSVVLPAGTASANTAPEKNTSGTLMTVAEAGAKEYNNSFYQTKNSGLRYGLGGTIFDAFADAGNSTTVETDLHTYTTPASTLADNGSKIYSNYAGTFVSSGTATRQMKVYFGGTAIFDSGTLTISASAAWDIKVTIIRVSSTVVRYTVAMNTQGAALAAYTAVGELTGLTLTNTNIIKVTGQAAGVGAATNDIILKLATGEWKPVAAN